MLVVTTAEGHNIPSSRQSNHFEFHLRHAIKTNDRPVGRAAAQGAWQAPRPAAWVRGRKCLTGDFLGGIFEMRAIWAYRCGISLGALLGLALILGCGPSYPKTIKVSGRVTYQGKPLTNGKITFGPVDQEEARPAWGALGEDGSFSLSTWRANDGARPGDYRVVVQSYVAPGPGVDPNTIYFGRGPPNIPEKYFQFETSGLTATVNRKSRHFEFNLE